MTDAFNPALAHRLSSLAIQAYFYDSFEPWAKSQGYTHAESFHEGSIQAKLLDDGTQTYLIFAGTDLFNLREWVQYDFDLRHTPLLGGWVHRGFHRALHARGRGAKASLFQQVATALTRTIERTGRRNVIVAGHSLGAALAKLFAAEVAARQAASLLAITPDDLTIYTTGEPRQGDAVYAAAMEKHYGGRMHRGAFGRDWVPQVPITKLGYRHSGTPHFIERDGTILPGVKRVYYRTSGADHLPQRYARAYANALRKQQGEACIPIGRDFKQTCRDIYEVGFHPGRGKR